MIASAIKYSLVLWAIIGADFLLDSLESPKIGAPIYITTQNVV